ncbi:hypothetical protein P691DRAFT_810467 [Macrolepiota fuliginosa MF-IS2]|uniref:Uncharacterized protein n=1 Tax=Macrolepiota fuliginosa MF-IS2 TaxID=1400762 RepID=A0A9P6BW70_9AGAR|nr:hypothetical protein P691DRAFT_810467 [Macrolepiota fuliginosa MF-IS2]
MSEIEMLIPTPTPTHADTRFPHLRTKPLTPRQERRAVAYLDDQFLQLTRGFKKRTSPSTSVPTLHKYISAARRLLAFILQIPPIDPSTELRIQYMLRLTGDVLSAIPGYGLPSRTSTAISEQHTSEEKIQNVENGEDDEPRDYTSALRELLDWLDDLDQAWLAVLQSQVWDPEFGEGVDLVLDIWSDTSDDSNQQFNGTERQNRVLPKSTLISQTDATRLRSILIMTMADLEEWLSRAGRGPEPEFSPVGPATGEDDVTGMLERLGLLDGFDELFGRTMDFLGGFGGFVIEPNTIVEDGSEDEEMVEVVMSGCS